MKVLVIHPESNVRDFVAQALSKEGCEVNLADDATSGMREFHRQQPHIVVVAEKLSAIDGGEFCVRLRRESDVPVIIVGEDQGEPTLVRMLELGADAYVYLTDPIGIRELTARVRALLRRYKPTQERPEHPLSPRDLVASAV